MPVQPTVSAVRSASSSRQLTSAQLREISDRLDRLNAQVRDLNQRVSRLEARDQERPSTTGPMGATLAHTTPAPVSHADETDRHLSNVIAFPVRDADLVTTAVVAAPRCNNAGFCMYCEVQGCMSAGCIANHARTWWVLCTECDGVGYTNPARSCICIGGVMQASPTLRGAVPA